LFVLGRNAVFSMRDRDTGASRRLDLAYSIDFRIFQNS